MWKVPLFDTHFSAQEEDAVLRPLRRGWLSSGPEVEAFEHEFAVACKAPHAVAVASGTAALHLACMSLGIGPGDEVLCPSLTFVADANAVRYIGAIPVLCECAGADDLTIDPVHAAQCITEKTRAIIVVHYAGFACDMKAIMALAKEHNLVVIEDCAHALFTRIGETCCGLFGQAGCFSFYPNKNMTTAEGGMVITGNADLAQRLRRLRSHGQTVSTIERHYGEALSYDVRGMGFNYRLDEIRAALGRAQLQGLPESLEKRRRVRAKMIASLDSLPVDIPFKEVGTESVGLHIFPVLLPVGCDREKVMNHMKEMGVQTSIHYPPIHGLVEFGAKRGVLPITEDIGDRELTLPFFPEITDAQIALVSESLASALEQDK
jgi:dTDP-4-amino-4,6-dideoxygalactose transaminase